MKAGILVTFLLMSGCASGPDHNAAVDRAAAACEGRVRSFEHETSSYRQRLAFTCPPEKKDAL